MYVKLLAAVVETLLVGSALATPTSTVSKRQSDIEAFITKERPISLAGVLANIGPDGSGAQGASAGVIVASPSKSDPDCKRASTLFLYSASEVYANAASI